MASGDESNNISVSEYLRELKSNISTWEDIVMKSQKLNFNFKNVGQSATHVIDSIGLLCGPGRFNVAGIDRVTQLLSEITVMERYISEKACVLNKAVQDNLVVNLSQQIETWRRNIGTIKKDREIDGRKAKAEYKKSLSEVTKLEKKINKRSGMKQSLSDTMSLQADYANQDLQNKERFVEELERCVLRKAICEERSRYRHLIECLRPVLEAQLSMRDDFDQLQRIYDDLYSAPFGDLSAVPTEVESYVRQYQVSDRSRANSFCSVYSRANSQLSLVSSSRSSSVDGEHFTLHSTNLPPYCADNLDTSSSTLHDPNNESMQLSALDKVLPQLSDDDTDDALRPSSTDVDTICADTALYPNQALPPPRYSNLRQLKQNAEKKYGLSTLSREMPTLHYADRPVPRDNLPHFSDRAMTTRDTTQSHYSDRTLSRNSPSSHYSDCTFSRELPRYHPDNGTLSRGLVPSHYSDCTLTRHSYQSKDPAITINKADNDIYSTISQIYGTASLFSDVTSGTSTFKRRKPSNVTAMDAPVITDKRFYQPPQSDDPRLRLDDDQRNLRAVNTGREQLNIRHSMDLSNLNGYCLDKNNRQKYLNGGTGGGGGGAIETVVTRPPSSRNSSHCRDLHLSKFSDSIIESSPVVVSGKTNGDSSIFKQQLLQVIQTGRTSSYQKPLSSVCASHMF